jgi:hypothetical protein
MSDVKRLNRNAFSEKLIHRYLLERYYFSNSKLRNLLLPEKYHLNKINLIVPEKGDVSNYRADLTIYFKDIASPVPVEVKWVAKAFTKPNQVNYIRQHQGFVVSFSDPPATKPDGIEYIKINYEDFYDWTSKNITKLTRESISSQVNDSNSGGNQYWVVLLRGTAHQNFYKMVKQFPANPFWAFEQNDKALKNIFNIDNGDTCIFILGKANEGMGMSANPNLEFMINSWFITKVKEPYYMVLTGDKGTFFESGKIPIYARWWPHFIDFEIIDSKIYESIVNFGKRHEFAAPFADSYNNGHGTPSPLNRKQAESLIDQLRSFT